MNRLRQALLLSFLLFFFVPAAAEPLDSDQVEKVVVTAHREAVPAEEVGSSVTVITGEDLERTGRILVLDALRAVPALEVARNGGPGGTTSVFLRGANAEHTLVLVDGVEQNDPMSPSRGFDFGNLAVNGIDRIEILRGPQSTLYGSDALGGVIHIITKRGGGGFGGNVTLEAGSFSTMRGTAAVRGGGERSWYAASISHLDTDGISAADQTSGNTENDGTTNRSLSARLGMQATERLELNLFVSGSDSETDLDNYGGSFGDDPNSIGETERYSVRGQGDLTLLEGDWTQTFAVALTDYHRTFRNPVDPDHPADRSDSRYDSNLLKLEWQNRLRLDENHNLVFGLESEKEEGESSYFSDGLSGPYTDTFRRRSARTSGLYLQDRMTLGKSAALTLGFRLDDHQRFGDRATFRAAFSARPGDSGTRLRGSIGTGFKAPSLFQLYSSFGNEQLSPEESTGWDLGIEQQLADRRVALSASWFRNDFDHLIQFDGGAFVYANIAGASSRGLEFTANAQPHHRLDLALGYTWTDTKDDATGEPLLRRPEHKLTLAAHYRATGDLDLDLEVAHAGVRDDLDFSTFPVARVELPEYTLLNLSAGWRVTAKLRLHLRVENALDEAYQEVLGFGAPGRGGYAALRWIL